MVRDLRHALTEWGLLNGDGPPILISMDADLGQEEADYGLFSQQDLGEAGGRQADPSFIFITERPSTYSTVICTARALYSTPCGDLGEKHSSKARSYLEAHGERGAYEIFNSP